jgi:hypothetical protein
MRLDRLRAENEPLADAAVRQSLGHEAEHVPLARRELVERAAFVPASGLVFVIAMWFQSFDFADVQYEAGFVLVSLAFPLLIVWHVSAAVVRYRRARRAAQLLSV